jgi:hypothetical protein
MGRILLAAVVLAGGLTLGGHLAPSCTYACTCAKLSSLADYVEGDSAVMMGRTGPADGEEVAFAVERWFAGPGAAPVVTLVSGDDASCGVALPPGRHLVFVAYRDELGRFHPSICAPMADVDTPDGQALVEEAVALGTGIVPIPIVPEPSPPAVSDPRATLALLAAGVGVVGGLVLLVGVVALLARRRPSG